MYYQKALAFAKTSEQKAKCHYMIAKCERNEYYNNYYIQGNVKMSPWPSSEINFIAWEGFKTLKSKYSKTQYYQEVIKECGYFKTYVSQNK